MLGKTLDDKIDRFINGDGLSQFELMNDMRMYANMYKFRYTNLLPRNFRHEFMIETTRMLLEELEREVVLPDVDDETKSSIQKVFAGKFWFSNMAWFNELKRYFKIEMRYMNDGIVDSILADFALRLEAIAEKDPNHKIHA